MTVRVDEDWLPNLPREMRVKKVIKLKGCPFCGGNGSQPYKETEPSKRPVWEIHCSSYCIVMRRTTKKEVIHDWNNRAT